MGERSEAGRVWLLGGFEISVGQRTIEARAWRLKKAAGLVKVLSLAPGHRLHREQVMDLLWPDLGKKAASNNLRQALHAARRVLDPAVGSRYLASEDESLALCPGGNLWVDVEAFEEGALNARRAGDPAAYRAALELYAGDLLPEDRYEAWAEDRREGLRQFYLALLLELAGLHDERGEHGQAVEVLRKATAKEPTLEVAHAALMRHLALRGRPEQALAQYERLRDILSRRLGTRPGAATRHLRDEIAAGRLPPTPSAGTPQEEGRTGAGDNNLPAPRTSFVGRERELTGAKRTLAMTRLLTLTGAGGSGKTRLALEVARDLVGAYPDGAWLVELAPLTEPDLVVQEVASALGVAERPGQPFADTLVDVLRDKGLLLIVDNCEHLLDAAARLADALLDSCPRLRVLATSREPLGVRGEALWQVPPLSLPTTTEGGVTAEGLMRYEAVRLFVDRARLRLPGFGLTQGNAGAVARVCRKLDGLPLAIELATARMGALAVEQVAQRLEASLDVLRGSNRGGTPRQRTLKATLDWSHDLLGEDERLFFSRLSVFAGGWTLEAAEAVCSGDSIEEGDVLDLLVGLVDKSLVLAGAGSEGTVRYRMLEPVLQYAREKLEGSGELELMQERHAAYFLDLAQEAEPKLDGPHQELWVERLEIEHDNLRAALARTLEQEEAEPGLRLGGALWKFWHTRGHLSEGLWWLEQALAGGGPAPLRIKALEGMGWLTQLQGDTQRASATYGEMLELSQEQDDKGNVATALNSLGMLAVARGDNEQARALLEENLAVLEVLENEGATATMFKRFSALGLLGVLALNDEGDYARGTALWEECLALAREAEDSFLVGSMLSNLGYAALLRGENERAAALCEEALTVARDLGSAGVEIVPEALVNLGLASLGQGDQDRAVTSFNEALAASHNLGRKPTVINCLEGMADQAVALGEDARAARLWGAAEVAREATSVALPPGDSALHAPYQAAARSRLGEVAWEEALAEGRAMALEDAAEHALSKEGTNPVTSPLPQGPSHGEPPGGLTRREREVALLVARGLTNRQMATELSISERTVATYVGRVLRKLGLRSRAQIAAWVTERRLLTPDPD